MLNQTHGASFNEHNINESFWTPMMLDLSVYPALSPRPSYRSFARTLSGHRGSVVVVAGLVAVFDNADNHPRRVPGAALCGEPLHHIRHLGGGYA